MSILSLTVEMELFYRQGERMENSAEVSDTLFGFAVDLDRVCGRCVVCLRRNDGPYEDAVLAQMNDAEQEGMAYAGRSFISENR